MTTSEISKSLIGKRVKGILTALPVTGTIIDIIVNPYSKGVQIRLDGPVRWGDSLFYHYTSTSRVDDEFGNLKHTHLLKEED